MKKFLGLIALALFVCLPLSVNATISVKDGMKCTEPEKNSEGKYAVTCTLTATTTAGETISTFSMDLTFNEPDNIELDESSVKGSGAFQPAVLGNTISFNASTAQSGEKIELGSFTYYVKDLSKSCSFTFTPTTADLDPDPVVVPVVPENPETGSAVSYIAIVAGVLLIASAYVVSRKNTKMYKI